MFHVEHFFLYPNACQGEKLAYSFVMESLGGYFYFLGGIALLIGGYKWYGMVLEKLFRPDPNAETPAVRLADGVDYVIMPPWRVFLIQLLNIAGLGPVFGAVLGALYGPACLLWIVFGCLLGGMVHDYFAGMISLRHKGENLPELLSHYLGKQAGWVSRVLCVVFSLLVGVVFALGPAAILASMTGWDVSIWIWAIFAYYFLATILPIQAIMGKIYPFFAVALILMVAGIFGVLLLMPFGDLLPAWLHLPNGVVLPDTNFFVNQHPKDLPIYPVMFITIACGAISGFHATQSPLMARCMKNEMEGKAIFGGAMVAEGVIALIWAVAVLTFYGSTDALGAGIQGGKSPALAIQAVSQSWLGYVGSILVMLGVVVLPISTGDGALRVTRLMIADCFGLKQSTIRRRLLIAIPLFGAAIFISRLDFNIIWQYFGWANQLLAATTLWAVVVYLRRHHRAPWVAAVPAMFLTSVVSMYLFSDRTMCGLSDGYAMILSFIVLVIVGSVCFGLFGKNDQSIKD